MKRRLDTRTLGVIVALVIVVYAAVGYFMVVSPKKGEAVRLDEEIAATQVELQAALAATAAQDDTQPIAVADIFRLSTAMPSTPDMSGIVIELERIAAETGIRFESITPQSGLPVGAYQVVPIDVTFDGTFYALSDFLFRLRTLVTVRRGELHAAGRLFAVASVDFSEAESGFPLLAANLKLNAYVYGGNPAQSAVPPAAETPPATTEGAEVPPPAGSEATGSEASG